MATITIRNLPEDVYAALVEQARSRGQSLQAYLRDWLVEGAQTSTLVAESHGSERPTIKELVELIEADLSESGVELSVDEILAARDEARLG